jgi:putative transposase
MGTPRKFSVEQKLSILEEARQSTKASVLRKYNLSKTVFDSWRHKYELGGADALAHSQLVLNKEVLELKRENDRLKKMLAERMLELEIKNELLKKSQSYEKIKNK